MNNHTLWSLRLGFSNEQSKTIEKLGLKDFLDQSFNIKFNANLPEFLLESPKSIEDFQALKAERKLQSQEEKMKLLRKEIQTSFQMKAWWIDKIQDAEFPLTEKMTCFWHNHFVATFQKVKVNYWIFNHNQLLRKNAFGNFKDLTKMMLKSNAIVKYLDNVDNKKGKLNENLSRELLELFTIGIGNYTEQDIKNGAKGLAGLSIGSNPEDSGATYKPRFEDNESFEYFGKKGNFKIDEMIDIIFEQPNITYHITRKILQWFIYDNPKEDLVKYYGDYFKQQNFEIKPLLTKIFTEEFDKKTAGSKIKNPLEYILQITSELQVEKPNSKLIALFLKQQNMDLFNQPNVKGWIGGNYWLTSQTYLQRNNTADLLCNGKNFLKRKQTDDSDKMMNDYENKLIKVNLDWNKSGNNKQIIAELKERLLFNVNENAQLDFEKILKYDFNLKNEGSHPETSGAVLRLFNAMVKMPEFQII